MAWNELGRALVTAATDPTQPEPLQEHTKVIAARNSHAAAFEEDSRFALLVHTAALSAVENEVLALCAAIEMDRSLQRTVGELTGDLNNSRPDLDLIARLLGTEAIDALADDAGLQRAALVELEPHSTFAATRVHVPKRVLWALRDDLSLDPELPVGTELVVLPPTMIGTADCVLVHGDDKVRREQTAMRTLAPLAFLLTTPPTDDRGWRVLVRMATVGGLGVVLDLPDGEHVSPAHTALTKHWVERASHLSIALCSRHPMSLADAPNRDYVEVAAPPAEITSEEWAGVFGDQPLPARRPTATQVHEASSAWGTTAADKMRRVTQGALLAHAKRVVPRATWDDLVLPPANRRQLRGLLDRYRHRATVHDEWGLSLYPSPGVVALFSGPSGTGKSTSAEVLAHELGMEMFRIDLSALVSKYIGETEKNLEQIFSAAHTGDYLLLFDEADSLFGSRSKVNDARDRYANLEVSYLLQRLETYDGFVVLTSNFQGNIDQAFLRRIHATVHFSLPTASERAQIWERSLVKAPREDLDLDFVAEQFDLSGGSIRNAALSAAFSAAAQGASVTMVDVLHAVAAEMNKLGRRPNDSQFGPWLGEVLGGATS